MESYRGPDNLSYGIFLRPRELYLFVEFAEGDVRSVEESSDECPREMCDNLPENFEDTVFRRINGSQGLEPKLYCRTTSSLVWHWEATHISPVVYVVSVRDGEESWVWHDVVSTEKFIIDELPSESAFQLKVLHVEEDGSFAGPCSSEWVSPLNASFNPSPVINLTVAKEYEFSEDYVNISIKWEPNEEDMTCDYKVLYWNLHGEKLEETDVHMEFSYLLPNLYFNNSYRAYVISGDDEKNNWGKEMAILSFSTPSCLDVWNNNLSICNPPPPKKINIHFLRVDLNNFDMNISWIPDKILPEQYAVFMSDVENPKQRNELKFVNGNLEKETPKEKNYESTSLYFDDEWEIPEDRLLVIDDAIGRGAFGVVHKGLLRGKTALEPSQNVAVKMLRDYSNLEDVRQFQQEINMMKSIGTHSHIVSIIGCCTRSKQPKLVIEYCALGALLDYLQKYKHLDDCDDAEQTTNQSPDKPTERIKYAELMPAERSCDPEYEQQMQTGVAVNQIYFENCEEKKQKKKGLQPVDLLSFARQIAMGMEFLASNRIVHRDLAARNVLVCADKTMKISDFGLSKDVYERNVYHMKRDSKLPMKWTAIESLMFSKYTTQSDVWAFGVLLWEIVTFGKTPYPGIPQDRLYQLLRTGYRMECPPNCSEELYCIMLSCWKAKPKDRPTFTELRNKLDSLLETTSPQQYLNLNITNAQSSEMLSAEDQSLS
ncbi:Tyrosine-protein kinase receptor torso [Gryllus bimaculatus]|nr:Tyrosine-protein kinase receptor torso [Gryllus bimaculatus]